MNPDAVIAADQAIKGVFVVLLWSNLALIASTWWAWTKVIKGCPSCAHCQRKNSSSSEAIAKTTRERLFGRQDVEPPEEGPQDGPDDGS